MPDPRIVFAEHGFTSIVLEPKFTIQVNDETSRTECILFGPDALKHGDNGVADTG
jgi:hypothetical protein